jgi:hypothetical protein
MHVEQVQTDDTTLVTNFVSESYNPLVGVSPGGLSTLATFFTGLARGQRDLPISRLSATWRRGGQSYGATWYGGAGYWKTRRYGNGFPSGSSTVELKGPGEALPCAVLLYDVGAPSPAESICWEQPEGQAPRPGGVIQWLRPEHLPLALWLSLLTPTASNTPIAHFQRAWRGGNIPPISAVGWSLDPGKVDEASRAVLAALYPQVSRKKGGSTPWWLWEEVSARSRALLDPWDGDRWAAFRAWCALIDNGVVREVRLGVRSGGRLHPWGRIPQSTRSALERLSIVALLEGRESLLLLHGWDDDVPDAWQSAVRQRIREWLSMSQSQALLSQDRPARLQLLERRLSG